MQIELPETLTAKLAEKAAAAGCTDLHAYALGELERAVDEDSAASGLEPNTNGESLLDIARRIGAIGTFQSGVSDLATNPEHLDGFGR